ncbi:hypothetical protein TNCV_3392671 [Trichonephila clavipes]|nr:hypothetical protein TNCV_3392671 [Trichonephila clavipes]
MRSRVKRTSCLRTGSDFHKASTDACPQHGLCPTNKDTWCEYNRAITTGEVYKHKNTLPSEMLNCIKNVYRELSTLNFLVKCLHDNERELVDFVKCSTKILADAKMDLRLWTYGLVGEAVRSALEGSNAESTSENIVPVLGACGIEKVIPSM